MVIKQRRTPKQARAVEKYQAILDASARVLQRYSFEQITMSEISLESDHPYATIYQYFSNKDDIYRVWLERLIDRSLCDLAELIQTSQHSDIHGYIEVAVRHALNQVMENQQTLQALLGGMPLTASTMAELMESKTLQWMEKSLGSGFMESLDNELRETILTAIRVGNGYWLQAALNTRRSIDIERESRQFAAILNAMLSA